MMIIMNIIIHFFILITSYKVINAGGGVDYSVDKNAIILPMQKLKRNLEFIKEDCGEVCDTSDNFVKKPGLYFDKIVKNIECDYLFESPLIDSSNADMAEQYWHRTKEEYHNKDNAPPKMDIVPQEILQHYTFDGRIQLQPLYAHAENGDSIKFKNANLQAIHEKKKAQIWSRENIEASQEIYRKDIMKGIYGIEVNMTKLIKEYLIEQVQGGHVLVIGGGSESPWIETILLELGAARVTTLHLFSSVIELDHPKMDMITPEDLRRAYIKGQAPTFDAMISFSALQHRGLGRYGDSLNPWGDLITMAKAWCLTKPKGRALVGVPSGMDLVLFNSNRNYGRIMNSHLFASWNVIYSDFMEINDDSIVEDFCRNQEDQLRHCFEPLTIIEKPDLEKSEL